MPSKLILLVDDDPTILGALATKLAKPESVEVMTTTEPAVAQSLARSRSPALIVCDLDMPGMDGGTLAAALQTEPATARIPILFLTSLVEASHVARSAGAVGGRRMVSKGSPLAEIVRRIQAEAGIA